jgi:hypothetical protein
MNLVILFYFISVPLPIIPAAKGVAGAPKHKTTTSYYAYTICCHSDVICCKFG